jgi:hypothetical protein
MKKTVCPIAVLVMAIIAFAGCPNPSNDVPKKPAAGTLTIDSFPGGSVEIYDSAVAVASQTALDAVMAGAPIATATGNGSQLSLKAANNQAFAQTGTFLVVVTENGNTLFKAQVSFENGGAAFNYTDLQNRSGLPATAPEEPPTGNSKYAKEYWGEYIRIDNGDTWYISGNKILVNGNQSSLNPGMTKQSAQVIKATASGRDYLLFASRTANASLRGKIILMDDASVSPSIARARSVGRLPPIVRITNPKLPELPIEVAPDPGSGDIEVDGLIAWDEIEVTFPDSGLGDGSPMLLPPPPAPPDDTTNYVPPMVPIPVVTEGVNLKVTLRPQNASEDATRLYANGTSMDFVLEVENVGTEVCTAAIYDLEVDSSKLVVVDRSGSELGILRSITPKSQGGSAYKKSIPLTVTANPLSGTLAYEDIAIGIRITSDILKKTWNDSVSIRYNRERIPFRIVSETPVQGIIKVPGGKTHHFKTESSASGYDHTIYLPWSREDYFVIFAGADASTEARYSLGINTAPSRDFVGFRDFNRYEGDAGNNDEEHAYKIESNDSIMAYLHMTDIDYYRINLGNEMPVVKLVPMERYAFSESGGNGDSKVSPGETAYLDLVARNETPQNKDVTVQVSASGEYAAQVTFDRASATMPTIPPQHSASLTDSSPKDSSEDVELFVGYRMNSALKLSVNQNCPTNISIPLTLSFSDTQGMSWSESISLAIVPKDTSIAIEEPVAANCVLSPANEGDSHVNPGDSFSYAIKIKNSGTESVAGLTGVLTATASASHITMNSSTATVGTLEAGSSGTATFRFTVNPACPPGTEIPFKLALTSSTKQTWELSPPALAVELSVPGALTASASSTGKVDLTWTAVPGATGYRVYYASTESGDYTQAGSTTGSSATAYAHEGLAAGVVYYYKVSAIAGDNLESAHSAAVPAKTWKDLPAFNTDVSGTVAEGIPECYRFYVSSGMNYTFTSDKAGTVLWASGKTEWFTLNSGAQTKTPTQPGWAAIKFESPGDYSFSVALPIPGGLKATAPSTDSVVLTWNVVPGASGYGVYWAASETGNYELAGSTTGSSAATYTHSGLSAGTVYFYKVSAFGGADGGESEKSQPGKTKTWANLVFNKSISGSATADIPDYYRFHVSSGVTYSFVSTSNKAVEFMWESGNAYWFTLNSYGTQTQTPGKDGWVFIKFENAGEYSLTVKSGEAAVTAFTIGEASTATISETDKTIAVLVPYGTSLASLTPTVAAASGWTCATTGAQNFSGANPVEYRFAKNNATQTYAVTVTRRGQGGIVITPPGEDISIAGFPAEAFAVSLSGSPRTITITDTGYTSYEWHVDDAQKTADTDSGGRSFTVNASDYPTGAHTLTLIVYKDGVPWSNERRFTVAH